MLKPKSTRGGRVLSDRPGVRAAKAVALPADLYLVVKDDDLLTFDQALETATSAPYCGRPTLLTGNGFSVGYSNDFGYARLRDCAAMDALSVDRDGLFDLFNTDDFETVMDRLETAAELTEMYRPKNTHLPAQFREDKDVIRDGLVEALAAVHPAHARQTEDRKIRAARIFLSKFRRIFTTNYDLLLYWATNMDGTDHLSVPRTDSFSYADGRLLTWARPQQPRDMRVLYLHGALHLYRSEDPDGRVRVRKLRGDDGHLVQQMVDNLADGHFPFVITEGTSKDKVDRIAASAYLRFCHASLRQVTTPLFVHGLGLSENDRHIIEAIAEGNAPVVYVGIHGGPSKARALTEQAALEMKAKRAAVADADEDPLEVRFYQSESAKVWGS